jgi:hypothetical protein
MSFSVCPLQPNTATRCSEGRARSPYTNKPVIALQPTSAASHSGHVKVAFAARGWVAGRETAMRRRIHA